MIRDHMLTNLSFSTAICNKYFHMTSAFEDPVRKIGQGQFSFELVFQSLQRRSFSLDILTSEAWGCLRESLIIRLYTQTIHALK